MRNLFIKKTFLGLVGLLFLAGLFVLPGINRVGADGGSTIFLPFINSSSVQPVMAAMDTVFFGPNATWKYFDKGSVPGTGWMTPGFADGSWAAGSALLGFGNGNERTIVSYGSDPNNKYTTTYFRKTFTIDTPATITALAMDLTDDDGAIVYLNGKEIARHGMPSGTVGYSTYASSCIYVASPVTIAIAPANLVAGNNTFAVEVHQCSANSSDLTFGLALHGTVDTTIVQPTAVPTTAPTAVPTLAPTATPTQAPTATPTTAPTAVPTIAPTVAPTIAPTIATTIAPTTPPTSGLNFYVSTSGSSGNSGSINSPWDLQTALNQPAAVKPGSTIWVRGGKYTGAFISYINGTSSAPIIVRAYPGERATILNSSGNPALQIDATSYVYFWGLEITSSYSTRDTSRSASTYGVRINQGVSSTGVKFINSVIHDMQAQGMGIWQALTNSEVYGTLFYFNGTTQLDHGIYAHNVSGTKSFVNNFIFDNASHGFHGYAETSDKGLNNFYLEGNTLFNNGSVGYNTSNGTYSNYKRNILMGGLTTAYNDTITNNFTYYPGTSGASLNLGYSAGTSGAKVTNNYFAGGTFDLGGTNSSLTMTGNTVYAPGGISGFSTSSFPSNTWLSSKPSGVQYFVRPNKYENNRANITIYNWAQQSVVSIPASALSGVSLVAGQTYELHNVQNYYGDVVTATFDGANLNVPMTGHSVAQPVGLSFKPNSTFPTFGGFVLIGR